MLSRMEGFLVRIDNFQTRFVVWVLLIGNVVSLAYCVYDHFAPWSRVALGLTLVIGMLSVALRGIWRMELRWRPAAAIASFAIALILPLSGSQIGLPASLRIGLGTLAFAIGLWLYYKICVSEDWWPWDLPDPDPKSLHGGALTTPSE